MESTTSSITTTTTLLTAPASPTSSGAPSIGLLPKFLYSAPASPIANGPSSPASNVSMGTGHVLTTPTRSQASSPVSGVSSPITSTPHRHHFNNSASPQLLTTPKKQLDSSMLQRIREKLLTPGGPSEASALWSQCEPFNTCEPVNVIKDRYLISTQPSIVSAAAAAKTPASYRHLIDLTCSNLKCTDVFTEQEFLCRIINEPLCKVQRAYFQLKQETSNACSSLYGHSLIRPVHDIVPLSKQRTYVIVAAPQPSDFDLPPPEHHQMPPAVLDWGEPIGGGVYEDLHTYIRNKRRLDEVEARALFHQICETVQICHRNGIILRDLKLKRFYFIDAARTRLQYESLEGCMILEDPDNDTLSDKIGCPLYTAPELLCPNPTYRGKPADMWSLGVILYTMLVGQYPFYEKGNCNLITVIRHCHVQLPPTLSRPVRSLLLNLLCKNLEERIPAEEIFMLQWLKQQRPIYAYITIHSQLPSSDDEDYDDDDDVYGNDSCRDGKRNVRLPGGNQQRSCCPTNSHASSDQPLDYTCSALQMELEQNSSFSASDESFSSDMTDSDDDDDDDEEEHDHVESDSDRESGDSDGSESSNDVDMG